MNPAGGSPESLLRRVSLGALALAVWAGPAAAHAQDDWNSPRTLQLMERARERRAAPRADSTLSNYQARAAGYVYFFLDRRDTDERTLVKVDQLALDVYWAAPARTKQRIVGLRDEKRLPNDIHYHLDHLTVVQDEFGDAIRLGDGDEVRDVPHPASPGSAAAYDFRLADSLSIHLAGATEPIRVYEVQVRPRDLRQPAFVGSIYLDRATAAIVRMTFTFTPAAYVDRRLDYIRISLDNALWEGRWWLPHEQKLEIRRQVPELDFPAGGVIRGELRIREYLFNQELPDGLFRGPAVVALPPDVRESFPFDEGLYEGLDATGLQPAPELGRLRERAAQLVGFRRLSGLPRLRVHLADASSAFRYNRAEGVFLGGGATYSLAPGVDATATAGYASGAGRVQLGGRLGGRIGGWDVRVEGHLRKPRDLGPLPGAAGALNTLAALLAGSDYLDLYSTSGLQAGAEHLLSGEWRYVVVATSETHRSLGREVRSPPFDDSASFRPVRPVTEGRLNSARLTVLRRRAPGGAAGWWAEADLEVGRFASTGFTRSVLGAGVRDESRDRRFSFTAEALVGGVFGASPDQRLFLLGGRETLPGHPYRGFVGDRFALIRLEADHALLDPWLRVRLLAASGAAVLARADLPPAWPVAETERPKVSLGTGVGLLYDILRLDVFRGVGGGGHWQAVVSVNPRLRDIL